MYSYKWNVKTGGYTLTPEAGKFVASEIRPVYAAELKRMGFGSHFNFDSEETGPICWAKHNTYIYRGEEIAKLEKIQYGKPIKPIFLSERKTLKPVDLEAMLAEKANIDFMAALLADTQKRLKEMYDQYMRKCDIAYIGFSGGKDSILLLDICHRTLPLSVPVVFSDTDMELPDTYRIWEEVQRIYPERTFIKAKAEVPALENWKAFGPPSHNLRWCCSVHKSTPAILKLKEISGNSSARMLAFVGVRGEESIRRSSYDDIGEGQKNSNQTNAMPILAWGAHELFLYSFAHKLPVNEAYKNGISRVGCVVCPMSSARNSALAKQLYPEITAKYEKAIEETITREFTDREDLMAFIGDGGWHARRSGVTLRNVTQAPGRKAVAGGWEFSASGLRKDELVEWLKALGRVTRESACEYALEMTGETTLRVAFGTDGNSVSFISADGSAVSRRTDKLLRFAVQKAIACTGCRECQAECPTGALRFSPQTRIDTEKCVHCLRCYGTQEGCARYFSTRYAGGSAMGINGINKYINFGLRPEWISVLTEERENFRATMRLGTRMVPSAVTWFREAGLIGDGSAIQPTKLADFAEQRNVHDDKMLWECIWARLSNASPLIKWYVTSAAAGEKKTQGEIGNMLEESGVESAAVRKGALSSLCSIIKNSPISSERNPVVEVEAKGSRVISLTRVPHMVEDLALLYGLFAMAETAGQTSFSVSGMMAADFSAKCVSPLVAFAMPVAEFKQQCQGLADRHGDFVKCNFTHGLDEIQIMTAEKSIDDVVELMMKA